MIKNINKIPDAVYTEFEKKPEYFLKGIQVKPGMNGTQQHDIFGMFFNDEAGLKNAINNPNIIRFTAFKIGEVHSSEGVLRAEAKKFIEEQTEKREREQYEKLKKKFELLTP